MIAPAPPIRRDEGDVLRIGDTRVTLDTLVRAFHRGMSPEEFVLAYPAVTLAEAYLVIAYYLQNRTEVDDYIRAREERAEIVKAQVEARHPEMADIRERLLAKWEAKKRSDL